jgi:hypothetical protein
LAGSDVDVLLSNNLGMESMVNGPMALSTLARVSNTHRLPSLINSAGC